MKYWSGFGKKRLVLITAFSAIVSVIFSAQFISCNQDAIFAHIAEEPAPKTPMIQGPLPEIVIAEEGPTGNELQYIYVANSQTIWKYREGAWDTIPAPDGRIIAITSDGTDLYALSGSDVMSPKLYKKDSLNAWGNPFAMGDADGFSLESIYCADDGRLFVGGRKSSSNSFNIFYLDGSTLKSLSPDWATLISGEAALKGVVESGGVYYIAAGNNSSNGILRWDGAATLTSVTITGTGTSSNNVTGIKDIGSIIAVTWNGHVLQLNSGEFKSMLSGGLAFTGGIAVWEDKLILLGVHSGGRNGKGYREIKMPSPGNIDFSELWTPGTFTGSSMVSGSRFGSTIARYSVYSIMQVPKEVEDYTSNDENNFEPVIFAASQSALHSLRNEGEQEWNLED